MHQLYTVAERFWLLHINIRSRLWKKF